MNAYERLNRFFDLFAASDHVIIVINADPDSIASAMAVKRILWRRVNNVTISKINIITRPDNMAMIRLLDVPLVHVSKIDPKDYNKFIIVDSQPHHHELFSAYNYTAVIDHHEDAVSNQIPYKDVRPEYGATASIMTEYLRAAKIKPSGRLATGLYYAIKTDTANFERNTTPEDMQAFHYLFKHANIHLARKIEQVDLRLDFLDEFKKAINNYVLSRNKIYVYLGKVKNTDICVLIADFFMRFNLVTWSVVSGIYENKLVIVVRNDGSHKDAGKLLTRKFNMLGSAGGHKSMARAEILTEKLKGLVDIKNEKQLMKWIVSQFENKYKHAKHT